MAGRPSKNQGPGLAWDGMGNDKIDMARNNSIRQELTHRKWLHHQGLRVRSNTYSSRRGLFITGHNIPPEPTAGKMVQSTEALCKHIRLLVGRRRGDCEIQVLRHSCHCCDGLVTIALIRHSRLFSQNLLWGVGLSGNLRLYSPQPDLPWAIASPS